VLGTNTVTIVAVDHAGTASAPTNVLETREINRTLTVGGWGRTQAWRAAR